MLSTEIGTWGMLEVTDFNNRNIVSQCLEKWEICYVVGQLMTRQECAHSMWLILTIVLERMLKAWNRRNKWFVRLSNTLVISEKWAAKYLDSIRQQFLDYQSRMLLDTFYSNRKGRNNRVFWRSSVEKLSDIVQIVEYGSLQKDWGRKCGKYYHMNLWLCKKRRPWDKTM